MEYTINIKGRLMDLGTPQVMGILNVTPDSFYSGSRKQTEMEIAQRANQIIEEGGSIIDVGAFSTRPGADEVSEEEEGRRLKFALDIVRREQPDAAVELSLVNVINIICWREHLALVDIVDFDSLRILTSHHGELIWQVREWML